MGDAHLHWHINQRKYGDLGSYGNKGRGPVWWYPMEKMYSNETCPSEEQLKELKEKLLTGLNKLD